MDPHGLTEMVWAPIIDGLCSLLKDYVYNKVTSTLASSPRFQMLSSYRNSEIALNYIVRQQKPRSSTLSPSGFELRRQLRAIRCNRGTTAGGVAVADAKKSDFSSKTFGATQVLKSVQLHAGGFLWSFPVIVSLKPYSSQRTHINVPSTLRTLQGWDSILEKSYNSFRLSSITLEGFSVLYHQPVI